MNNDVKFIKEEALDFAKAICDLDATLLSTKYSISTAVFEEITESLSRYARSSELKNRYSPPLLVDANDIHISEVDEWENAPLRLFQRDGTEILPGFSNYGVECSLMLDNKRSDLTLIFDIAFNQEYVSEIHFCLLEVQ